MFEKKHYDDSIIVTTKEEFSKAVKGKYGTICIKGDLLDVIKEEYEKKYGKFAIGSGVTVLMGLLTFLPFVNIIATPVAVIGLAGLGIGLPNASIRHYLPRDDMGNAETELYLLHKKEIDKIRDRLKGKKKTTVTTIDQLNDAIIMKVDAIYMSKKTLNKVIDDANKLKLKKISIDTFNKYRGYAIKEEGSKYKFVRIR